MSVESIPFTEVSESIKCWLNFSASTVLFLSLGAFMVFLFGRDNSFAHRLPAYGNWLLRVGVSMCSAGALLNAVTFSNPSWSEVLLNVGLCLVFAWAAVFHYMRFVKPWAAKGKTRKSRK